MKKKLLMATLFFSTLLLGGCSIKNAKTEENTQAFSSLHEQLDSIQTNVNQYMNAPSDSNYIIATSDEITTTFTEMDNDLLIQLENVSKDSYQEVHAIIIFYDADNQILYNSTQYLENVLSGHTYTTEISYPMNQDAILVPYDHYEIQLKALLYNVPIDDFSDKVAVTSNKAVDGYVIAKFTNNSDRVLNSINSYILYYDETGSVIGCDQGNVYDVLPNSYDVTSFSFPYSNDYHPLEYAEYKIVITSAINTESILPKGPVITMDSKNMED